MKRRFFQKSGTFVGPQKATTPVISGSLEVVFRVGNGAEALFNQVASHSGWNQFCSLRGWVGGLGGHHVAAGDEESRSVCLEADDRVSTRICGMRM